MVAGGMATLLGDAALPVLLFAALMAAACWWPNTFVRPGT
jgi:hypothetical protein